MWESAGEKTFEIVVFYVEYGSEQNAKPLFYFFYFNATSSVV